MDNIPALNPQELEYLHDTSFLLAKRKIARQLDYILATTERTLVQYVAREDPPAIPDDCLTAAGKISRGENYRGLPYLVLDYPRLFSKENIFSFRTMCWWGHFFSFTLHLQGQLLQDHRPHILQQLLFFRRSWPETYICVNKTPWEYHYGEDNYQLLREMDEKIIKSLTEKDFIKLSRKTELVNYKEVPDLALESFHDFLAIPSPQNK